MELTSHAINFQLISLSIVKFMTRASQTLQECITVANNACLQIRSEKILPGTLTDGSISNNEEGYLGSYMNRHGDSLVQQKLEVS